MALLILHSFINLHSYRLCLRVLYAPSSQYYLTFAFFVVFFSCLHLGLYFSVLLGQLLQAHIGFCHYVLHLSFYVLVSVQINTHLYLDFPRWHCHHVVAQQVLFNLCVLMFLRLKQA